MPEISRDDVAHLAKLARIDLTEAELDHLAPQLTVMKSTFSFSPKAFWNAPVALAKVWGLAEPKWPSTALSSAASAGRNPSSDPPAKLAIAMLAESSAKSRRDSKPDPGRRQHQQRHQGTRSERPPQLHDCRGDNRYRDWRRNAGDRDDRSGQNGGLLREAALTPAFRAKQHS